MLEALTQWSTSRYDNQFISQEFQFDNCNFELHVSNIQWQTKINIAHGRRQGGAGGGHGPPGFPQTLSLTYQISKILPFLVVNTGPILIGPP